MLQLMCVVLPTRETPWAERLVGHVEAALAEKLWHVAVAQRKAIIEPAARAADRAGEAVVLVTFGVSG